MHRERLQACPSTVAIIAKCGLHQAKHWQVPLHALLRTCSGKGNVRHAEKNPATATHALVEAASRSRMASLNMSAILAVVSETWKTSGPEPADLNGRQRECYQLSSKVLKLY